jgi:hypothetical protein
MTPAAAKASTTGTPESLTGRTLRWTFADGPVAGKTYEHTFNADGSVDYRSAEPAPAGTTTHEKACATDKVSDDVFVISYLAASGYALTVVLNFRNHRMIGFASNEEAWYRQQGTFTLVEGGG